VVDNLGVEDLDVVLLSKLCGVRHDADIECENRSVLLMRGMFSSSERLHGLHAVLLVDGTDVDGSDRDFRGQKEFEERFERTDSRSLHTDTFLRFVDVFFKDIAEILLNQGDCIIDLGLVNALEESRASHGVLHKRRRDLDTHRSLDLLMVLVLTLDTDLLHRVWSQQRANLRSDRAVQATDDDSVTDLEQTIDKDDIDSRALTLDNLDLKNGALKHVLLLEPLPVWALTHLDQLSHQIAHALTSVSGSGHEREIFDLVNVALPVGPHIPSLLVEGKDDLTEHDIKVLLGPDTLGFDRVAGVAVNDFFPLVESIDFVEGDAERCLLLFEELNRLKSLLFQPVHNIDHKHGQVTEGRTSGSQVGERLVTGSVDHEEAGHIEFDILAATHAVDVLLEVLLGEVGRSDLLGNSTSFAALHIRVPQLVEDLGFSRVDVTQNTDDGATQFLGLACCFTTLGTRFAHPQKTRLLLSHSLLHRLSENIGSLDRGNLHIRLFFGLFSDHLLFDHL